MCKDKSKLLVEEVSKACLESGACRYSYFKRLLNENTDNSSVIKKETLPLHANLRGKEEYR